MFREAFLDICTESRLDIDAETLKRIEAEFNAAVEKDRRLIVMILLGVVAMIAGGWIVGLTIMELVRVLGGGRTASIVVAATVTPTVLIGAWFVIFPPLLRRTMRRTLRNCGYDICVTCGYNLTATPSEKPCPECGKMR